MEYKDRMQKMQQEIQQSIIETAFTLYLRMGIEPVKMTDIAETAGCGVASLYRYFGTKKELTIRTGIHAWHLAAQMLDGIFTGVYFDRKSGIDQCAELLKIFPTVYCGHPGFIRYLSQFDAYMTKENATHAQLADYEKSILTLQEPAMAAYKKGVADGTVRTGLDFEVFYFSTTHALMALAQKLVTNGAFLESDTRVAGETQLRTLIDIALNYIKSEEQK